MNISLTRVVHTGTVAAVLLASSWAAAEPSIADKATARSLFDEGRSLVDAGNLEQACPKFKASYDLDPGAGSAFHLADCYERTGRIASAWILFLEVAVLMRDSGDKDKEAVARARAAGLEPRLSRLTIDVPKEHAVDGLTIVRDGEKVNAGSWNTALPVDAGEHTITVSAPGREAWTTRVAVGANAAKQRITVPLLPALAKDTAAPAAPASQNATAAASADSSSMGQKTIGLLVGGGGVLVFGVGTFLGLKAKSSYNDSDAYCDGDRCTQQGLDIRSDARSNANVATIVGGLGLAAMVGGAALYFTAPSNGTADSGTQTAVGLGPGSVVVRGTWQ